MKILRTTCYILAILLTLFNSIGYYEDFVSNEVIIDDKKNAIENFGYVTGMSFGYILAIIFFVIGYWLNKRIKRKKALKEAEILLNTLPKEI